MRWMLVSRQHSGSHHALGEVTQALLNREAVGIGALRGAQVKLRAVVGWLRQPSLREALAGSFERARNRLCTLASRE